MGRPRKHNEGEPCEICEVNPKRHKGGGIYDRLCASCRKAQTYSPWLLHRGKSCEMCDYTPMFRRALDVHHRDGDKENNEPDNLMTICATCHRELEGMIHDLDGDTEKAESMLRKFLNAIL